MLSEEELEAGRQLAEQGIGEGDFDGDNHEVPDEYVEAYEALEFAYAATTDDEDDEQ